MGMFKDLQEDMDKSLTEVCENTKMKQNNEKVEDIKVEIESLRKTNWNKAGTFKAKQKTSEVNLTNKVQDMEERISGVEDKVEETDTLVKIC